MERNHEIGTNRPEKPVSRTDVAQELGRLAVKSANDDEIKRRLGKAALESDSRRQ